jgi:hypothetical protein
MARAPFRAQVVLVARMSRLSTGRPRMAGASERKDGERRRAYASAGYMERQFYTIFFSYG